MYTIDSPPQFDRPPFIIFTLLRGDNTWKYLRQRPHHLGRALASLGWPVVFIEAPSQEGSSKASITFRTIEQGLWLSPSWNQDSVTALLEQLARLWPESPWLFTHPSWAPYLNGSFLADRLLVYDCIDDWEVFPGTPDQVKDWEIRLASTADLVLASSMPLWVKMRRLNENVEYISNAVNIADYRVPLPESPELSHIPSPRLLFVGYVSEWVDLQLIDSVARMRPEWSIIMVGPSEIPESRLPKRPNIHWMGKRPYVELPMFTRYCDVGLIPFKQGQLVWAVNPVKIHEYLASGLPVVATLMPDLLLFNSPWVRVANGPDRFVSAIEEILAQTGRPAETLLRGSHTGTWLEKAQQIVEVVASGGRERYGGSRTKLLQQYTAALEGHWSDQGASPGLMDMLTETWYVGGQFEKVLEWGNPELPVFGCALVRLGMYEQARQWLSDANVGAKAGDETLLPMMMDDDSVAAYVLQVNGEFVESLRRMDSVDKPGPIHSLLGARAWHKIGFLEHALAAYASLVEERAFALPTADYLILGDIMRENGRMEEAEGAYLRAAERGSAEAERRLADLYLEVAYRQAVQTVQSEGRDRA
ncbi:MAG: glycosyltransferase [Firmicutes bacterium]|nr:glycosyltransferase [Bacillota bacterium]